MAAAESSIGAELSKDVESANADALMMAASSTDVAGKSDVKIEHIHSKSMEAAFSIDVAVENDVATENDAGFDEGARILQRVSG